MKRWIITCAVLALPLCAAAAQKLGDSSDKQLEQRWNTQADKYGKGEYKLQGCASLNSAGNKAVVRRCLMSDGSGELFLRRSKSGDFLSAELWARGNSLNAGSMFLRFVRNTDMGDMGTTSSKLMQAATRTPGSQSCTDEQIAKVCALSSDGMVVFSAE